MKLEGKTAFVSGAGSGIGRAIALTFAREGARVAVADIRQGAAEETIGLSPTPELLLPLAVDMRDGPAVSHALAATMDRFGSLEVLVNNAGAWRVAPVDEIPDADWDELMAVNLRTTFLGTKYALPLLRAHQPAAIVNLASLGGVVPRLNSAAYCAAKAGVIMLTQVTARENLGRGVRANSISPGGVDSGGMRAFVAAGDSNSARGDEQPVTGRFIMSPDEVAKAALFLASDESLHLTGHNLVLDDGLSLRTLG